MKINYVKSRFAFTLAIILSVIIVFGCDMSTKNLQEMPVTSVSKDAIVMFNTGLDHFLLWENEPAQASFKNAISLDDKFALAYLYLAMTDPGTKTFDKNLNLAYESRGNASPGEALFIEAFQYDVEGKGDLIVRNIDSLMLMFPDDKLIPIIASGWFFYSDDDKCIALYKKAIEIDPDFFYAHIALGQKYSGLKEYDKALECYLKGKEILPENPVPIQRIGVVYRYMGEYEKAVEYLNKAKELNPDEAITYASLGHCYSLLGEYEKARDNFRDFRSKSDIEGDKIGGYYLISASYLIERDFEKALEIFDQLIEYCNLEENKIEELYAKAFKGYIYMVKGELDKGKEFYEKAIAMIPETDLSASAIENLNRSSYMWRAFYCSQMEEFEKAEENLENYEDLVAGRNDIAPNWFIPYLYGMIYVGSQDFDNALESLQKALEINPTSVLGNYELAKVYDSQGDLEKAKEHYNNVLDFNLLNMNSAWVRPLVVDRMKDL